MSGVSRDVHSAFVWILGLVAVVVLAGAAQWFMPERTVQPIADRFLCSGPALVTPASNVPGSSVLSKVECIEGLRRTDVTNMAFLILTIPSALAVAAATILAMRFLTPKPKTRIRRAMT